MRGSTDKPVERFLEDEFRIAPYVEGLGEFIRICDTPMTVAIQGDWGCGKTSMMNMVRDYLGKKEQVLDVWFNTWQFSQFNMDDKLVLTFLQHLLSSLSSKLPEATAQKLQKKLGFLLKTVAMGVTKQIAGDEIAAAMSDAITPQEQDAVEQMVDLKKNFEELVKQVSEDGKKRVVIFIDDLDRLQPVRAVELLEVLKLFLDCDNCVFVMAIDTSVVFQGIREKYGQDISDEKAQSFFDKMIQLPFKMPVRYYKLNSMISRLLDFLKEDGISEDEIRQYTYLIRTTTGSNPRSIKRLVNSFMLTDMVAQKKQIYLKERQLASRKILLALSCIQLKYENLYNFILKNLSDKPTQFIQEWLGLWGDDVKQSHSREVREQFQERLMKMGAPIPEVEDKDSFLEIVIFLIQASKKLESAMKKTMLPYQAVQGIEQIYSLSALTDFQPEEEESTMLPAEGELQKVQYVAVDFEKLDEEMKKYFEKCQACKESEAPGEKEYLYQHDYADNGGSFKIRLTLRKNSSVECKIDSAVTRKWPYFAACDQMLLKLQEHYQSQQKLYGTEQLPEGVMKMSQRFDESGPAEWWVSENAPNQTIGICFPIYSKDAALIVLEGMAGAVRDCDAKKEEAQYKRSAKNGLMDSIAIMGGGSILT